MFEGEDIAFNGLEVCSYRHLQGMAKKMGLPSNVKKVHLIEMIRAKKYCTETDLKAIVNRVKMERKVNAQAKKKKQKRTAFRLQGVEISSTSNSQSPPISLTPKRPSDFVIQYSPDITHTLMKYQPRPNILRTGTSILQPLKRHIESDRVLRSFNSVKRPNYRIMEQSDCMLGVVNAQSSVQEIRQERVQEIRQERAYHSVNVTIQKHRPIVTTSVLLNQERQLVPVSRSSNVSKTTQRQRKLSGIYPLPPIEEPVYEFVPTVGFRRNDGRMTKINAVIQKPLASTLLPKNHALLPKIRAKNHALATKNPALVPKQKTMTVQDMINYKVDHPSIDISKNVMEAGSSLYEIDYQSNEIDHDIFNDYPPIEERAVEARIYREGEMLNHVSQNASEPIYSMSGNRNIQSNPSRKVYKGCQSNKTVRKKAWNYSVEYQEHDSTDTRNEWNIYDINGQLLDKTVRKEQNTTNKQCNKVEDTEPISTNYSVKQGRITEPISRDYQVEYQRYNQEMTERYMNARPGKLYQGTTDSMTQARPYIERFSQEITDGNMTHARSGQENLRSGTKDMGHASSNKEHWLNQEVSDKNMNHPRPDSIDASSQYPNMSSVADVLPREDYLQEPVEVRENSNLSVYYHKKIRAEHVKTHKVRECARLPRISEAFSQFNDVQYQSLIKPLYVQVSEESERVPLPRAGSASNTCVLESLYNFKSQYVTNPPGLLIAASQTRCTYSTHTVPTAIAQPAAADLCNTNNPSERASPSRQAGSLPRLYEYLKPEYTPNTDFGCDEVLSSSTNSLETTNSQVLGANVTIPEMVEDALELISQDGDYMERIGMDVRVQCILCDWAGPKIILEYHIKKKHSDEIQHSSSDSCSVRFSLGELARRPAWRSRLVQRGDALYVLAATYVRAPLIMLSLSLSMISTESEITKRGRITIYNKISGQPFVYEDDVKHLPDSMPYDYGRECLTVDIGKLDLVPDFRLVDREWEELPELNSVEVIVYVKLIDLL